MQSPGASEIARSNHELIVVLESILDAVEELQEDCSKGLLRAEECREKLRAIDNQTQTALPPNSAMFRIFDRRRSEHTDYCAETISGYVDPNDCKNALYRAETLRQVLNEIQPEFLRNGSLKTQYFFPEGEYYRAQKRLFQIMKRSRANIVIIDEHLDEVVFDYVETLDPAIAVQMLTGNRKPIFSRLLHALQGNRPNIEARENTVCHDRFLMVDSEIWQLGNSINGFGKKASMINKVKDQTEADKIQSCFLNWWVQGRAI